MVSKLAAGIFNELLKVESLIGESALKRARAQAKFFCDILKCWALPRHGTDKSLLYLFADVCTPVLSFQLGLQMHADNLQHFFVMGHKWSVQITAAKNESVAVRFEIHAAAKMGFKERPMLRRTGEIDSERSDLAISAMPTHT